MWCAALERRSINGFMRSLLDGVANDKVLNNECLRVAKRDLLDEYGEGEGGGGG